MKKLLFILCFLPVFALGQHHMMHVLAGQSSGGGTTLKTGLVSCWEFNETSGTTAYDSYGTNDGTITGATVNQTGLPNLTPCYNFDGNSDYVLIPNSTGLNLDGYSDSYSISAWVKSSDPLPGTSSARIIEKRLNNTGKYPFSWQVLPSSPYNVILVIYDGSNVPYPTISGTGIWDGNWHLIVMVVDNSSDTITAYLDGANVSSVTNTTTITSANTGSVAIGASETGVNEYLGDVDQVIIWSKALTTTEITTLNNSGNGLAFINW